MYDTIIIGAGPAGVRFPVTTPFWETLAILGLLDFHLTFLLAFFGRTDFTDTRTLPFISTRLDVAFR